MIVASYSSTETLLDLLGKATGQVIRKESVVYVEVDGFTVVTTTDGKEDGRGTFRFEATARSLAKAYV